MRQQWEEAKIRFARTDTRTDTDTKYHKVESCNIKTEHSRQHFTSLALCIVLAGSGD